MWLGPGGLAAGIAILARLIGLPLCRVHHLNAAPDFAQLVALERFPELVIHGLVLCSASAVVLRSKGATSSRFAARGFAALVFASALTGWPLAAPADLPSISAPFGFANLFLLLAASLSLVVLTEWLPSSLERRSSGLVLLLLGAIGPAAWLGHTFSNPPSTNEHVVAADLLSEPDRWTLVSTNQEHKPSTGVLTPWVAYEVDGGDKPALIMPAPCEANFKVLPSDGPVRLRLAAGVDQSVDRALPESTPQATFGFEVLIDGEPAYETAIEITRDSGEGAKRAWRHPKIDLELTPGQTVTLRTSVLAGAGVEDAGCKIGFGALVLERAVSRARRLATTDRPSMIVFVMDTQRFDRMSSYGNRELTTPHTDALASRGTLFEAAYSTSSWTWPATASILTGLVPEEHGVLSNESCTLALSNESLPEALAGGGYATGAFSCNPLIAPGRYFDQGFEDFDSAPEIRHTGAVIDSIEDWITARAGARFFLYLHLADPHTPHEPLPAELARLGHVRPSDYVSIEQDGRSYDRMDLYARNLLRPGALLSKEVPEHHADWIHQVYDASVATGDHYLGRVMARLEELGLSETTVVAVTADHGEELFDHERLAHGHTLHAELVRVPLLLAGPGLPTGVRVKEPISNRHLAPTLARIGGVELPSVTDPLFLFNEDFPERVITYQTGKGTWGDERGQALYGIREGDWVLHYNADAKTRSVALYNVKTDPREQNDLAQSETNAEIKARLLDKLRDNITRARARRSGVAIGVGSAGVAELEGIGYIDVFDDDESDK
jgi:arylsulfatase A-like enzyme